MDNPKRIRFHKILQSKVEPLLTSKGFKLVKLEPRHPEGLTYERQSENQPLERIIFHGGGFSSFNKLHAQASSGDIHLINVKQLMPNYAKSSLPYDGWEYTDENSLDAVTNEIAALVENHLLLWFDNPIYVWVNVKLDHQQAQQWKEMLIKTLEAGEEIVALLKAEGKHEEAHKMEPGLQMTREALSRDEF